MKARFLALAALVLGLASCQNDFEAGNIVAGGEVDFQLSVGADELATRAGKDGNDTLNGWNSAYGAIDYLKAEADALRFDWTDVDLRYSLEVYDVTEDTAGNKVVTNLVPVKDRMVKVVDAYEPVVFDLRLVPNRDYRFVVFADFVAQGATDTPTVAAQANIGLRHDIGDTLQEITVKENNVANERLNDEIADAYFAFEDIKITNSNAQDMVLRRPYGKLRVIATDLAELNLNVEPNKVKVTYTSAANPNKFNAVTGEIEVDNTPVEYVIHYNSKAGKASLADYTYTEGYDAKTVQNANNETRHSHITLFTDYILAEAEQNPINFKMEVFDRDGGIIKETMFNTAIPVQRNYLTTVIGNVLTTATEIDVRIDDNFADENGKPQLHTILETLINGGEFTLTEDLEINVPTTLNGDAIINLNGHKLTYTIPADCEDNTSYMIMTRVANGSSLTFVGDGEVVSDGYIASANEGGKVYVNGGNYSGDTCTLFQANGGKVYISGGVFQAAEYNGDYRYTLNHVDSKKNVGKIEVTGGKFYKYNPAESASENPVMNFAENCAVFHNGDWFEVYYVGANLTIDAIVPKTSDLESALTDANVKVIYLQEGNYPIITAKSNKTIIGSTAADVECVALNGADNVTLINIEFDAADAKLAYNGKGKGTQYANIISGDINKNGSGSRNLVIDGCKFTGTFADGGVAIAFTDQSRGSGQSGDITIKNCTFETKNGYCDIYCNYSGYGEFVIENNVFNSELLDKPIYLGRYQSNTPVVVKGNTFARCATFADAASIQAHSTAYSVSFDASNNTFAN